MRKNEKKLKKLAKASKVSSIHKQTRLEVDRMTAIIKDHAKDEHVAWKNPTKKGLEEFDHILYGLMLILLEHILEDQVVMPIDVYSMLETTVGQAGQRVEFYNTLKVNECKDFAEVERFVRPTLAYFHAIAAMDYLKEIEGDPEFECIFLAHEAKNILALYLVGEVFKKNKF